MARVVVVGAGPIGLFCAMSLARRGHEVTCVDRDPGPVPSEPWDRTGVMQFNSPHFFRAAVRNALLAELPDVMDAVIRAGGEPRPIEGLPEFMTGLACRRSTFERAFRAVAAVEPHLCLRVGHVGRLTVSNGIADGVEVDGTALAADAVICAAGRASHLGEELRGAAYGGPTGMAYVSRMYRARPGVELPTTPVPIGADTQGYLTIVFPQDDSTLSALIVRPSADAELATLREPAKYEAAVRAIPNLAPWTDPARFVAITDVMAGAGLNNVYRSQGPRRRTPPAANLYFLGDAICTTNPQAGRGIALGLDAARAFLGLVDHAGLADPDVSRELDDWSDANLEPWFRDHVEWDATLLARFAGADIEVEAHIPSDVVCDAADVLPELFSVVGPYLAMLAGPSVLDAAQDRVRELLRGGWRPAWAPGPSRDELVELIAGA